MPSSAGTTMCVSEGVCVREVLCLCEKLENTIFFLGSMSKQMFCQKARELRKSTVVSPLKRNINKFLGPFETGNEILHLLSLFLPYAPKKLSDGKSFTDLDIFEIFCKLIIFNIGKTTFS